MALTVTKIAGREPAEVDGGGWRTVRKIAFDASYTTGGLAITDAQLGLSKAPDWVEIVPKAGYVFEYDGATKKIKVYVRGAITENVAGAYTQNAVLAAAALAEVANAVDLSAVTAVIVKAFGRYAA